MPYRVRIPSQQRGRILSNAASFVNGKYRMLLRSRCLCGGNRNGSFLLHGLPCFLRSLMMLLHMLLDRSLCFLLHFTCGRGGRGGSRSRGFLGEHQTCKRYGDECCYDGGQELFPVRLLLLSVFCCSYSRKSIGHANRPLPITP